jgi:hypothetical protein
MIDHDNTMTVLVSTQASLRLCDDYVILHFKLYECCYIIRVTGITTTNGFYQLSALDISF